MNKDKPQTKGKDREDEKLAKILQPGRNSSFRLIDEDIVRQILKK